MTITSSVCLVVLCVAAVAASCGPGYYVWIRDGLEHCRLCPAGCACAGNVSVCIGCSGGLFSAAPGASACAVCPPGTTTDIIFNGGCDPDNYETPCANFHGPLGQTVCRPDPPSASVVYVAPNGAAPIPPVFDIDGFPMVQQSY